jgi:hypothetical protein
MRRAMAEAEVGDDVYGEDPTVARLQEVVAARLGFEAALWVPTGVMANEIAIRILTRPGQEVLAEERSHVVQFELAGMAVLSGVLPRIVRTEDGHITADDIRAARRPASYMRSDLGLVVLENTHNFAGGTVADASLMRGAIAAATTRACPCTWTARASGTRPSLLGAPLDSWWRERTLRWSPCPRACARPRAPSSCPPGRSSTRGAGSASSSGAGCARSGSWPRPASSGSRK